MARVLITDDDELVRRLYAQALDEAGHFVEEAEHGQTAISKLEGSGFDIVVMDLLMPVREGIETIIEIRRRWPHVRIIAISAGARRLEASGLLDLAEGLGAHASLLKPVTIEALLESIDKMLATQVR